MVEEAAVARLRVVRINGRPDPFYPQVELLRAQRALRRERAAQRVAKVVVTAMLLGLYWLLFTNTR